MIRGALLLLFASMLITSDVSAGENTAGAAIYQDQVAAEDEPYDVPDTLNSEQADTVSQVPVDSLAAIKAVQRNLFSSIIQPLALSAILGGLLLLIFTQRGR